MNEWMNEWMNECMMCLMNSLNMVVCVNNICQYFSSHIENIHKWSDAMNYFTDWRTCMNDYMNVWLGCLLILWMAHMNDCTQYIMYELWNEWMPWQMALWINEWTNNMHPLAWVNVIECNCMVCIWILCNFSAINEWHEWYAMIYNNMIWHEYDMYYTCLTFYEWLTCTKHRICI